MAEADRYSRRNGTSGRADSVRYCLGGKYSGGAARITRRPFAAFSKTLRAALELAKRRGRPSASRPGLSGQYGETYGRKHCLNRWGNASVSVWGRSKGSCCAHQLAVAQWVERRLRNSRKPPALTYY